MKGGLLILLAVLLIVGFMGCNGYNGLVKQDESVKKAWNNVQAEYQNRADLVGNLVNTVKGAANFEQKTLTDADIDKVMDQVVQQFQSKLNAHIRK